MFDKLTIMEMAKKRLDWAARRQEVLAENVSNANTPRYLAKDVKKFEFKDALAEVQGHGVTVTNPRHIQPPSPSSVRIETPRTPFETSPDGNGVVLEEQLAKISDTKGAYTMATDILRKNFKFLRTALGKGGS